MQCLPHQTLNHLNHLIGSVVSLAQLVSLSAALPAELVLDAVLMKHPMIDNATVELLCCHGTIFESFSFLLQPSGKPI